MRDATRRAINVNHLADVQFNKKGHYDCELETSTRRDISFSPTLSLIYSKVYELSAVMSKRLRFVAHA